MLAQVQAGSIVGIEAHPVQVEVDFTTGLPGFDIVGLPETAVRESRVRVKAALSANDYPLPNKRLLLNLAPGDLRKKGSSFDLAIAIGVLAACGACEPQRLADTLVLGELSLSGRIRPVRGVLAQLRSARRRGLTRAIVPEDNQAEAALAVDLDVRVARHLNDVVAFLEGELELPAPSPRGPSRGRQAPDLSDVRGQPTARRALEIAAAGGHHLLLVGPPGSGKTMLARRLPGLLPPPTPEEALDIATIAGAAGLPPPGSPGAVARPFRAPHHTASAAALIGGGDPIRPGEVTLAHAGVLFLDELPEFRRDVIESLRITMEGGVAVVARIRQRVSMPAAPLIVAAMNPCPCGWEGDSTRLCKCNPARIEQYRGRVSGPLLDRFDMHVSVPRVRARSLRKGEPGEPTAVVRERVVATRERAAARRGRTDTIADLAADVPSATLTLLERAMEQLGLSARAYVKVLRVGRTIADLARSEVIEPVHVAEALQYRLLDRGATTRRSSGGTSAA